MMKILIAYDGSVNADGALHDLELAGLPESAEARVLSLAMPLLPFGPEGWVPDTFATQYARAADGIIKNTRRVAERAAAYLAQRFPGWKVTSHSAMGAPAEGILAQAEAWRPDLIVLGSHGHSALGRMLMGSVSLNVLHHAPATVRIARPRLRPKPGAPRILVAVDGSAGSDAALAAVAARVWPRKTEARVIGIVDYWHGMADRPSRMANMYPSDLFQRYRKWIEKTVEAASQRLANAGLEVDSEVLSGDARERLVTAAKAWSADCIVIGSRGLGAVDRFLLGSVSSAVATHAPCSVEVVRGPGRMKEGAKPKPMPKAKGESKPKPKAKTRMIGSKSP